MDPPPHPPPAQPATTAAAVPSWYTDSANSSPRSHHTDGWDDSLPQVPGAKLRLMCSYGGRIVPRPRDKSLCYVGGETRIVAMDRQVTLADFLSKLSHSLLSGRQFTLKYQLPSEDLDSLVSVTTDEDLENMIEEYDRINSTSPLKSARLRLFLFPSKLDTVASMGCLLDDAKSEKWFVDVLNGAVWLPRGLSDSAAIDNVLEIDESNKGESSDGRDQVTSNTVNQQEVQATLPDSPMVETGSSYESVVSPPSMANLPPIKVRLDETGSAIGGLDEELSQMKMAPIAHKLDPTFVGVNSTAVGTARGGENTGHIVSDDETSDHGATLLNRKPPLPLQLAARKHCDPSNLPSPDSKQAAAYNLPSPDSVASDSSVASLPKQAASHDSVFLTSATRSAISDQMRGFVDPSSQFQVQQAQDSMLMPPQSQPSQLQQPSFVQIGGGHYIQQPPPGQAQAPIPSYYQVYAHPPPPAAAIHQQMDQQYPMYFLPVAQTPTYNMALQPNLPDSNSVSASDPVMPQNATLVQSATYKDILQASYSANVNAPQPEMLPSIYRTTATGTPPVVQVPPSQFHQQYYGLSQMHPPSQPVPANSAAPASFVYNYAHHGQDHAYFVQHPPSSTATALPQYQTIAPGSAVMTDNPTQQQMNNRQQS